MDRAGVVIQLAVDLRKRRLVDLIRTLRSGRAIQHPREDLFDSSRSTPVLYSVPDYIDDLGRVHSISLTDQGGSRMRFDRLVIHSWPDDELVRATNGQLRSKLETM